MTDKVPSPDALTAHLEGEAVLLHIGTKQYFRLNRTGAHIWKALEAGTTADNITQSLVDTFEVPREVAEEAVTALLAELLAHNLVRDED
ncbi:MAG: PqqD family protein [bacterium]